MSTQRAASLGRTAVVLRRRAVALALASFATVLGSWYLMVATRAGQLVEQAAITGSFIGARFVTSQARWLLSTVSMPAAVALVMVILVIGLWGSARRRAWWAAAVVVAVNVSTQVLKHWVLTRPDYGVSLRYDGANTLPSGHTAMAASAGGGPGARLGSRGPGARRRSSLAERCGVGRCRPGGAHGLLHPRVPVAPTG